MDPGEPGPPAAKLAGISAKQCRHLRADRRKLLRILECQMQRTEAAHGDAGDAARRASAFDPVLLLHLRHELFGEKVFIPQLAIGGVQEERVAAVGRQHHEVANLSLAAQLFDQVPTAQIQQ